MLRYSQKFKARMIERMQGPHAVSASALSDETGVAQSTLSEWLREARTLNPMETPPETPPTATSSVPTPSPSATTTPAPPRASRERSPQEKVRLLGQAQGLTGEELGAMLRREGVHAAELEAWRNAAFEALLGSASAVSPSAAERKRIQALERELERKDKALAEAAALLLLQKKFRLYLEGEDAFTDGRSGR